MMRRESVTERRDLKKRERKREKSTTVIQKAPYSKLYVEKRKTKNPDAWNATLFHGSVEDPEDIEE